MRDPENVGTMNEVQRDDKQKKTTIIINSLPPPDIAETWVGDQIVWSNQTNSDITFKFYKTVPDGTEPPRKFTVKGRGEGPISPDQVLIAKETVVKDHGYTAKYGSEPAPDPDDRPDPTFRVYPIIKVN